MPNPHDPPEPELDELEDLGQYANQNALHEHALVILAMGHPCWVSDHQSLHVLPEHIVAVREELDAYDQEQTPADSTSAPLPDLIHFPAGWGFYVLWVGALSLAFSLQGHWPWFTDRFSNSNLMLIHDQQWWRPFTALFLHADGSHLLGNLLSGIFFTTLVSKSIGPAKGWFWILICGTLGNLITSWVTYPEAYRSIGASTAVFAALGILSGFGLSLMLHHHTKLPWLRILSPVIAGVVILGMIGGGSPGGNTDVLGHIFGFLAGIPAGYLNGYRQEALKRASNS